MIRTAVPSLTPIELYLEPTYGPATSWTRMLTLCMLFVLLFSLCSFGREYRLFVVCSDDGQMDSRWKPIWIPYGGNFQKA